MDKIINSLNPGQSARISGDGSVWVTVERSGDGKVMRFVRNTATDSTVFKICKF